MKVFLVVLLLCGSVKAVKAHGKSETDVRSPLSTPATALFVSLSAGDGARLMIEAAELLSSTREFDCSLILVGDACNSNEIPVSRPGLQIHLIKTNSSTDEKLIKERCSEKKPLPECELSEHLAACKTLLQDRVLIEKFRKSSPKLLFFPGYLHDACILSALAGEQTASVVWATGHVSSAWLGHATNAVHFSAHHAPLQPRASSVLERLLAAWTWASFTRELETRYWRPAAALVASHLALPERSPDEAYRGVALLMSASHALLERPVPALPARVTVGCFHCRHAKPLPEDLQEWVLPRRGGLVVVVLPHSPKHEALLQAVARELPQLALLWLGSSSPVVDLTAAVSPANLVHHPLCAEQDAFGHGRARLVVSECSDTVVLGAVFHGLPLICVPRTFDHQVTTARVVQLGIGLSVQLILENFISAVKVVTSNVSYRHEARHLGVMVRDEPETAADRLVFWAGHAVRHWGHGHEEALQTARQAPRDVTALLDAGLVAGTIAGLVLALALRVAWRRGASAWRRNQAAQRAKAE